MLRYYALSGLFLFSCWQLLAQEIIRINDSCDACDLEEVIERWTNTYGLAFAYESSLLKDKKVDLQIEAALLPEALTALFADQSINYDLVNERYVVLTASVVERRAYCGRIVDAVSQEPLAGATVLLEGIYEGTQTDAEGYFSLAGSWEANQAAVFSFLGFKEERRLLADFQSQDCQEISLAVATISMPTAIIREFTLDMLESASEENRYRFNPERIPTLPGWGEPDVLRSLQLLPGISTGDGSATNLNIRGGTSDQNLLLWDGIPIYHSGHFFGQYTPINPFLVESVDVYRGGYQAAYGGRVAGVIDIQGKPKGLEEAQYGVGLNLINVHAFAEIPIPGIRSSLLLGGRRSYTDLVRSPTYQNLFNIVFQRGRLSENREDSEEFSIISIDPELFYQDFNFKWTTELFDKDEFSFSWYGGKDRFSYNFEAGVLSSKDAQDLSNRGSSFRYKRNWNENNQTLISLTNSYLLSDYEFTYTYDQVNIPSVFALGFRNQLRESNLDIQQDWAINPRHQLSGGLQWQKQQIDWRLREQNFDREQALNRDGFRARKLSAFIDYTFKPDSNWQFRFGLRREDFLNRDLNALEVFKQDNWQPRINASWKASDLPLVLRASTGSYRQYHYQIPIGFTDLGSNDQLWVVADDYFPALRSHEWSLGLQWQTRNWLLEIDGYRRKTFNLSARDLELALDPSDPFKFRGSGLSRGVDFLVRHRHRHYSSWLAYSLGQVDYLYEDGNGGILAFAPDHDERHRLNLTQMLSWPSWEISLSWHWSSGRPYTEPIGFRVVTNNSGEDDYRLEYARLNDERLEGTHRLDLTANYKWVTNNWRAKAGLSFYNLYNRRNVYDLDFLLLPPDLREGRIEPELVELERQMLPLTVNLFLQFEW